MAEDKLGALRQKLQQRSNAEEEKPMEEPKPKTKSNRMDRTIVGINLEELDDDQLTSLLDRSTVIDRGPIISELDRRSVEELQATAGYIHTFGKAMLRERRAAKKAQAKPEPETQPEPEPEPEPVEPEYTPHQPYQQAAPEIPPLSRAIIKEIDNGEREYSPYLQEIWESGWDYKDRRKINSPMYADQVKAKDFVWTHMNDIGKTVKDFLIYEDGSCPQKGMYLVIVNAYLHWKLNPGIGAEADPPFDAHSVH